MLDKQTEIEIKKLWKEKGWHFYEKVINGKMVKLKFYIGKEVDLQIFKVDGIDYSFGEYGKKMEMLKKLLEELNKL